MKKKYIIAASIEQVQSFLFDVLQAHEQEKQTERLTLTKIRNSSTEVSHSFPKLYKDRLAGFNPEILPCGSGSVFLKVELDDNDRQEARQVLDEIYTSYYHHHNGKMRISYGIFEYEEDQKISSIKNAKKKLQSQELHNEIILRNRDVLFNFPNNSHTIPLNLDTPPYEIATCKYYAETLEDLRLANEDSDGRFRVAMIKADFDGMGAMFKDLSDFGHYEKVSTILSKWIRLNDPESTSIKETHSLYAFVREAVKNKAHFDDFKIYPLYAAGDDIFIAVHVSNLIRTVFLLREFLEKINNEIKAAGVDKKLTMRIGIDITYNSQPIRYYYERADYQMEQVKNDYANEKNNELQCALSDCPIKLCIDESVFYIPEYTQKKDISDETTKYMLWDHLQNTVKLMQHIKKQDDAEINTFLYNLLDKVTDPVVRNDPRKLSNAIFYHLRPDFAVTTMELMSDTERARVTLYKKLYNTLKESKKFKFDDERLVKNFISTLRILLMFSDPRFSVGIDQYDKPDYEDYNEKDRFMKDTKKLISEPKDYVQKNNIPFDLRKIFMPMVEYKDESGNEKRHSKPLSLESSMIYRFKRIMNNNNRVTTDNPMVAICDLIESKLNVTNAEVFSNGNNTGRPVAEFKRDAFLKVKYDEWEDYFDSLLVFYRCESLHKQWKRVNPTYSVRCSKCGNGPFQSYSKQESGKQIHCNNCWKELQREKKHTERCVDCGQEAYEAFNSDLKQNSQWRCKECDKKYNDSYDLDENLINLQRRHNPKY